MVAQVIFVASGYVINIGLARLLGPAEYGIYAVVISLMTMVNLILSKGIPQALSKYIAHADGSEELIKSTAIKMQLIFSLTIFSVYFLLAGNIAELLNDPGLTPFIRISSFIVPGYAMYSILIGYLNGLHQFKRQALIAISYSIFKAMFILALVVIGYSVMGAIVGFLFAPLAALLIGFYFMHLSRIKGVVRYECDGVSFLPNPGKFLFMKNRKSLLPDTSGLSVKKIFDFAVPIMFFSVIINLIINIDLFFVKGYLTNYDAGIYSAVSTISKVPFYIIGGLYGAIFPTISNSTANYDMKKTCSFISKSLKIFLIAVMIPVLVISVKSDLFLSLTYSGEYIKGSQVLSILILGIGFFSLFSLFTTILNGSGNPRISLLMSLLVIVIDIVLNVRLIPGYHLIGAAVATSLACLFGCIVSGMYVHRRFYVKGQ